VPTRHLGADHEDVLRERELVGASDVRAGMERDRPVIAMHRAGAAKYMPEASLYQSTGTRRKLDEIPH
ncbi:MAG: hypothetical protein LC808_12055, partial [Actinobacteria bacterium]|nr:hypothetical protein [Actinomycetota bacterium]